mgnify:CR=1 FL=1
MTRPPLFDPKRRAFEWDGDPWTINVIGHGLMGSELYVRARACSFGWAGSLAFAAGARQVFVPVYGQEPLGSMRELHAFLSKPPSARRVEAMSFHPLGTARMSQTPDLGVVSTTGECWDAKNLYVMDGSVLPTSLGVNSQLPIMAVSLLLARRLMRESAASQG